ncbi:MAG: hypothetical protein RBS34_11130, partial [Desulfofustis sp.]|nr:hypothetical protein [Desulfofustis sp.]
GVTGKEAEIDPAVCAAGTERQGGSSSDRQRSFFHGQLGNGSYFEINPVPVVRLYQADTIANRKRKLSVED